MKRLLLVLLCVLSISLIKGSKYVTLLDVHYEEVILLEQINHLKSENRKFKSALGVAESSLRPDVINQIGAMGMWQFMPYTLKDLGLGHITPYSFRKDPNIFPIDLQEYALDLKIERDISLLTRQWWRGDRSINYLDTYVGTTVYGTKITLSGIIAACHLAGAGGVIRFFDNAGLYNPADANGTTLFSYMRKFSNYNYNHKEIQELNNKLVCLNNYRKSLKPQSLQEKLKWCFWEVPNLKDTEIVLMSYQDKITPSCQNIQKFYTSLWDLKLHYLNTIEEFYSSEALPLLDTESVCLEDMEKSNGTIQKSGRVLLEHILALTLKSKKEVEYFNSTLSQYGMPLGTSNSRISFQYLGLKKLIHLPHLGVA